MKIVSIFPFDPTYLIDEVLPLNQLVLIKKRFKKKRKVAKVGEDGLKIGYNVKWEKMSWAKEEFVVLKGYFEEIEDNRKK